MEFFVLLCIELSLMFLGVVALGSLCFLVVTLFDYRRLNNETEETHICGSERKSEEDKEL